jgi:endonuclease VIII
MPEGHTIHRYARLHRAVLVGRRVRASSPQGRFADGAARLDGGRVLGIAAHGKHLLYTWGDPGGAPTGDVLHVHLGLYGRFRSFLADPPPPTAGTRLALTAVDDAGADLATLHLAGATAVELLTPDEAAAIPARLGPDPLDRRAEPARFLAALRRRRIPVGEALMDQSVLAGIGNVYRAELLFRARLDPLTPAREVPQSTAAAIWDDAVALLRRGERAGRIVTVDPEDVGRRRRSDLRADQQRYVYKRHGRPCHLCGTEVVRWMAAGRVCYACPVCQGMPEVPADDVAEVPRRDGPAATASRADA